MCATWVTYKYIISVSTSTVILAKYLEKALLNKLKFDTERREMISKLLKIQLIV